MNFNVCWPRVDGKPRHRGYLIRERTTWRGISLVWIACDFCGVHLTALTRSYPDALLMLEALNARRAAMIEAEN